MARQVYLDEAGISSRKQEPYLVVAGVIVDPDAHWRNLETYIRELASKYAPDQDAYRFVFHAHELFHGSGYFDRTKWEKGERWKILKELVEIPGKFELPVVVGWIRRTDREIEFDGIRIPREGNTPKFFEDMSHAAAFRLSATAVERWMSENCKNEVVTMIAEDRKGVKEAIKFIHQGYATRYPLSPIEKKFNIFRSHHIVDTVHFAQKDESVLLQIADTCAFIIKRQLMKKEDAVEFFAALQPNLVLHARRRHRWLQLP